MFLWKWLRAPGHLLVAFLGVTLLPAGVLGWLGWRLYRQDQALEFQHLQDRLDSAAGRIVSVLSLGLDRMEESLPQASDDSSSDDVVWLVFTPREVRANPPGRLVYYPFVLSPPDPAADTFLPGEILEFQRGDVQGAIALFRKLAQSPDPAVRAGALLRLGRNLRKAGRSGQALEVYNQLARVASATVGVGPAELIARRARCELLFAAGRIQEAEGEAAAVLADLQRGRWVLDQSTFEFHVRDLSKRLRNVEPSSTDALALPAAVTMLWDQYQQLPPDQGLARGRRSVWVKGRPVLLLWKGTAESMTALAAGPRYLESAWSGTWRPLKVAVTLADSEGHCILGNASPSGPVAIRTAADTGLPWTVKVAAVDPASELARTSGRRVLLLAGLAMICLLVAGGSYLIGRATARELAVARLQSDFVSAVSHEFRTPLTSMRHLTELLEGGVVTTEERRRHYYSLLSQETRRLHRLVEGLLNFGRMEAGRAQYRFEPHDPAELVEEIVERFQREGVAGGFCVEVSATHGLRCQADRESFSLAVWNLLDNAVKYSPECRTVWVEVQRQDHWAAIRVRDRGLGIAPGERKAIFEKFVRGASAKAAEAKGTGIGLTLVRNIVSAHGGEIQLESEPGRGSSFTILLPVKDGAA